MFRAWKTTQSLGCIQLQNELIKKKKKNYSFSMQLQSAMATLAFGLAHGHHP
jgi:hypothetical protein